MSSGEVVEYGMPRVYNLLRDPKERDNVLFPNTWVPKAALAQLGEHAASLKAHPPIKPRNPGSLRAAEVIRARSTRPGPGRLSLEVGGVAELNAPRRIVVCESVRPGNTKGVIMFVRLMMLAAAVVVLPASAARAQFNGHNSLGDFGVLSGSQPAPGFYASGFYYRYHTDTIRDRNGMVVGGAVRRGHLLLRCREEALVVGGAYYAQWKLSSDDLGSDLPPAVGRTLGRHSVFGLGPEVTLPIATRKKFIASINVRYIWEFGARTKTEGQSLVVTATFPVPSIPLN